MSASLNLNENELKKLSKNNKSLREIAIHFKCSAQTIRKYLKQYGLYNEYYEFISPIVTKEKLQELIDKGVSTKIIADIFQRKPAAINKYVNKYNIQRPKPQQRYKIFHDELKKLINDNKTLNEIANYYGCSRQTIEKRCREYKVTMSKRNVSRIKSYKPYTMINGYSCIYLGHDHPWADANGRIREHIYIIQKHIGRKLKPNELVHHKNGIRNDNKLENLELCTNTQPPSQRTSDMIQFCEQYLKKYAPEKLKGDSNKC